jgi:predicted alpha-1,2-mannosidase
MKTEVGRLGRMFRVLSAGCFLLAGHRVLALEPVDEARPLVGTGGHGHTYPGATVPFGFVQLSPDTRTEGWDACSGYHYSDTSLLGFSHTHLSGTGCADLGDLLILPVVGELQTAGAYVPLEAGRFKASFTHENEIAQPGYYRVLLNNNKVLAELSATAHAGVHRYTFPASTQSHILLDLVHGLSSKPVDCSLKVEGKNIVTGYRRSEGWAKNKTIYFVIECSRDFKGYGLELDGKPVESGEAKGSLVRGRLDFTTSADQPITLRVGLSPVSVEGARKNLAAEVGTKDFDIVRREARRTWNDHLSPIRIESSDPNLRQTFYSALYHTMTAPTLYNDADGTYLGTDRKVHAKADFQNYCTLSLWDTFRAEHPLMTIIQPRRVNDFVRSMLAFYQESEPHALPMWPLASCETWCMIGYHSAPVIVDAYAKGFRDYDVALAYEAMRNTAMHGRNHQDEYQKLGYVPAEEGKRNEATSRTLEFAFDDWCIAQMAKALGKAQDVEFFAKRSENYRNVFDTGTGFFRGKTGTGAFREPFDPKAVSFDDFTEANAWQYTFAVVQDVPAMIQLYGGNEPFIRKVDQLFSSDSDIGNYLVDVSGLIGQYAHGNEPCHHVAYLYALAGAQYKTAQRVRNIMLTQYDNTPDGICGNDDCGQISAWYVFSALGLYPLNPASGVYILGSPAMEKATIQLDPKHYKGGTFTIIARNASKQNCYIKSAKLNGKPLERPWVTHEEIANGGTLECEMSIIPVKAWCGNGA